MIRLVLLSFLLTALNFPAFSSDTIQLADPVTGTIDLRPYLEVYYDSTGTSEYKTLDLADFRAYAGDTVSVARGDYFWLKFTVNNQSVEQQSLTLDAGPLGVADIYQGYPYLKSQYRQGFIINLSEGHPESSLPYLFSIYLDSAEVSTYFFRFQASNNVVGPYRIGPDQMMLFTVDAIEASILYMHRDNVLFRVLFFAFFGISFAFLALTWTSALINRSKAFFWNGVFIGCAVFYLYFEYQSDYWVTSYIPTNDFFLKRFFFNNYLRSYYLRVVTYLGLFISQLYFYQCFFNLHDQPKVNRWFQRFKYVYLSILTILIVAMFMDAGLFVERMKSITYPFFYLSSLVMVVMIFRLRSTLANIILMGSLLAILGSLFRFLAIAFNLGLMIEGVMGNIFGILGLYFFYYLGLNYRYRLIEVESVKIEAAKVLGEQRNLLLTNITHEFRTPLTVILGLASRLTGTGNAARREGIQRAGQRLKSLVDQILELQKIDAGDIQLAWCQGDLGRFVEQELEAYLPLAESRQIELICTTSEEPLIVDFVPAKVQNILANLLSNAFKNTEPTGQITLQLSRLITNRSGNYELKLSDTGKGIPAEAIAHIFDRFYQVDPTATRGQEGSGIGLAYTKELVKALGGTIAVSSQLGIGTTFTLVFPITESAPMLEETEEYSDLPAEVSAGLQEVRATPAMLVPKMEQPRILVVEDNADLLAYLILCLKDSYQVIPAGNGQQGLLQARKQLPDLIVSDVMMPVMDGINMLQQIRTDPRTDHIPVILLTAKSTQADKLAGLRVGADTYLSKPFEEAELHLRIEKLIEYRLLLQNKYRQSLDNGAIPTNGFLEEFHRLLQKELVNQDLSIEDIARQLHLDRTQLFRKVKQLTGESPSGYLRRIRLLQARKLLQQSTASVSEIAFSCGFNSPSHFSKVYRKEFGHTPTEERDFG